MTSSFRHLSVLFGFYPTCFWKFLPSIFNLNNVIYLQVWSYKTALYFSLICNLESKNLDCWKIVESGLKTKFCICQSNAIYFFDLLDFLIVFKDGVSTFLSECILLYIDRAQPRVFTNKFFLFVCWIDSEKILCDPYTKITLSLTEENLIWRIWNKLRLIGGVIILDRMLLITCYKDQYVFPWNSCQQVILLP